MTSTTTTHDEATTFDEVESTLVVKETVTIQHRLSADQEWGAETLPMTLDDALMALADHGSHYAPGNFRIVRKHITIQTETVLTVLVTNDPQAS